eukprot:1339598-Amorphochlora_amoeboformis.AAC.3
MEPPVDQLAKPPENPPIAIPANPGESRLIPERPGKISRRQGAMVNPQAFCLSPEYVPDPSQFRTEKRL